MLIANRGAIARRVVRACNELGVASVVVYSEADADAPYLAEAGESIMLPGSRAEDTYLNIAALTDLIGSTGADAVHPGYGFLAENADFAEAVIRAGAVFVGPAPRWLRVMGDKVAARRLLADHGYPTFPASELLENPDHAQQVAQSMGYPLMLKPVAGGGGIGMRVVRDDAELEKAYFQSTQLAERAFGEAGVYLEGWIDRPRHVEFQLLADLHGNAMHVYERECSIQRRHQKLIEESPAPGLNRDELDALAERAAEVVGKLGYDNVGTLETLRDTHGQFGFLELNARIQVEHAVTEAVTGLDLVATQIELAAGGALPARPPMNGHALEARVYAEDSRSQLPDTGVLRTFRPPQMYGVRVETGYQEGQTVTPYYDPLLAKVIGWGATREQAIGRTLIGLKGFTIHGVKTNIALLMRVLESEAFLAGRIHTGFLQEM
ncbi:MAG: ATP-grasp domain-containing protein [Gammaproteobacteria bacterium]|nr:ATP-grasp domain-containing protein [Gammaproteobacteria bacterium]